MKIRFLLLSLTVMLINTVQGQRVVAAGSIQDSRSIYQQDLDRFLQYLDKSQIPTGILYDRVPPIAELDSISGVINNNTSPSIKTSSFHFLQAWQELYNASYNQSSMIKPEWLDALIAENKTQNIVPIGVLNYQFNIFDSSAMTNNLISQTSDTMLHDVAGRPRSPYLTKFIFLASPLVNTVDPGNVTFQMPANMILQNSSNTLSSLYIDLGSGRTATLTSGGSYTVSLQQLGTINITFTATFSNGSQKRIYATVEVTTNGSFGSSSARTSTTPSLIYPCNNGSYPLINADMPFADYITGVSKAGQVQVGYYYANCGTPTLQKPIIILDGFDPGDERKIPLVYSLLNYDRNGTNANLGEEMRQQGYDVVIVNFPLIKEGYTATPLGTFPVFRDGGADYVERNALALVTLINQINLQLQQNGSTEKTIIVGPSMGGLISRYALAYMEKNGQNHNCKLWLSFDVPHLGANISIGAQDWLEYYGRVAGKKSASDVLNTQIGAVAAKQFLLHHWLSKSVTSAPAPIFRQQFVQNLQSNGLAGSNGFPVNLRKVAITNGSGSGVVQGTACGQVLNMKGYSRNWIHFFGLIGNLFRKQGTESNIYFSSNYGSTCKVFDGWYNKFVIGNKHIESQSAQTPSNTKSYDIVPGGYYSTMASIQKAGTISDATSFTTFSNVTNSHSFIPTISSLALTNATTRDWGENLSGRNLVCAGETPFDSYYTPVNNEDHIFITSASADWIKNEIAGTQQAPTYNFAGVVQLVSGSEPLCTGSNVYTVSNIPAGATISWQTSPAGIANSSYSGTGSQVTVNRINNGTFSLIATLSFCNRPAMAITSKSINVGGPSISIAYSPNGACSGTYQTWSLNASATGTVSSWQWTVDNPSSGSWNIYSPNSASTQVSVSGGGGISVTATNSCGSTRNGVTIYSNCGVPHAITASPNPATDNVTIAASQPDNTISARKGVASKSMKTMIYQMKVIDPAGVVRKEFKYSSGVANTTISLKGFVSGMYTIQAYDGTTWNSIKVIKQ